jgi:capsid assembly protease
MNITELLRGPWAVEPNLLRQIQAIFSAHEQRIETNHASIEARIGRPLHNIAPAYTLQEGTGVAVLELAGLMAPKANILLQICGGIAASQVERQVHAMAADPKVKAVVIDVDSGGGSVLGLPALNAAVRQLAARKPTVAVCTGTLCSGGYWVAAGANAVFASGRTDMVGSIGVVAVHQYDPNATQGQQVTEITAGRYKRMATGNAPLSADGRDYMQSKVDEIYRVFVETVAADRQASVKDVLTYMADGRVFIGQQAIDAGLVDGFASVAELVQQLHRSPQAFSARRRARFKT